MLQHYLMMALRNFWRYRIATAVNLFCLALGVTCFVSTYAITSFLSNSVHQVAIADRTQVVTVNFKNPALGDVQFADCPCTGPAAAQSLRTDFPQLERVARLSQKTYPSIAAGDNAIRAAVSYADPQFYDIFDLPFRPGANLDLLRSPRGAVVTEDAAMRLFGSVDVVGRRITILAREEVTIAAAMKRLPQPTQFSFDVIAPIFISEQLSVARGEAIPGSAQLNGWFDQRNMYSTYALLPEDGSFSAAQFEHELKAFSARRIPKAGGPIVELGVIPSGAVSIAMMNAQLSAYTGAGMTVQSIGYMMAALVLLIACVNYANLAAALATTRAREVGLRGVLGADRRRLMLQYLVEAALIGSAAILLVLLFLLLLTPVVGNFGVDLSALFVLQPGFLKLVAGLIAAVILLAGAYPAIVLSSIKPSQALRAGAGKWAPGFAPTLLVGVQFLAASFLLILVIISHRQNQTVLNAGRELAQEPVVMFNSSLAGANVSLAALRARLMNSPHVKSLTASSRSPMEFIATNTAAGHEPEQAAARTTVSFIDVTYGFMETFGLPVVAGRDFAREYADDAIPRDSCKAEQPVRVIIDRAFATQLGWSNPQEAIGKILYLPAGVCAGVAPPVQIIGVVQGRPLAVVGMGARASMYVINHPDEPMYASVRLTGDDLGAELAFVDSVWNELAPNDSGERTLLSEAFDRAYRTLFGATTLLFIAPAAFAFLIASIGLFGMTIHVTDRRRHEIGVRKSLGARTRQIVVLLLRDLSMPIVAANLIAWPLAWIVGRMYQSVFVNQTPLTPAPFVTALLMTWLIGLLIVSARTFRAARIKPATVLRYE